MKRDPVRFWRPISSMFVLLLTLQIARPVLANTIMVTSTSDSAAGSLRAAIASAGPNDTITFELPSYPATITVASPLSFGPSVTITGPGASNLTISGADGVGVFVVNEGAIVTISGLTVAHGSSLLGGGIFNAGTLTLDAVTVSNCTVGTQLGGGIFNSGTLTLNNSQVDGNIAGAIAPAGTLGEIGEGGGIFNNSGTLTVTNSDVSNNQALGGTAADPLGAGGGILLNTGSLVLNGSTVNGNFADEGGGISNGGCLGLGSPCGAGGQLTITNSTISGNSSYVTGSGIFNTNTATITGSTISNNGSSVNPYDQPASVEGGGIESGGNLTITNSTIWGNSGTSGAGGIDAIGQINLAFVTIADNSGGGIRVPGGDGQLTVKASLIAGNDIGHAVDCTIGDGATGTSAGFNLSDDASCASFFVGTGDLNSTAAGLDPSGLKNNGGPTQTVAVLPPSQAINAIPVVDCTDLSGNTVTTDQRGVRRPQGGACDIGAYEYFHSLYEIPAVNTMLLMGSVEGLPVPQVTQLILVIPLQAAVDFLNAGVTRPAVDLLNAFIGIVGVTERFGDLTVQQGTPLTTSAGQIIQEIPAP
jgi:hypothetical protein